MDESRFFPNPWIHGSAQFSTTFKELSPSYCLQQAKRITERCLNHHESSVVRHTQEAPSHGTLYSGSLGARCYLLLRMAQRIRSTDPDKAEEFLRTALQIAKSATDYETRKLQQQDRQRRHHSIRVTLLESPWVGSKALLAILFHELKHSNDSFKHAHELLQFLTVHCSDSNQLASSECEVLYGRAGAIQAILFLRKELEDDIFGSDLVVDLSKWIVLEGKATSHRCKSMLPLLWQWHETKYLGAAHGVVGILHMLLSLSTSELDRLTLESGDDVPRLIQQTIQQLELYCCYPSGNLKSSVESERIDRLVHWCHGAPGHLLLLVKASEVCSDPLLREKAERLAQDVVWPRGLLRKGVGLCHGISGNAYALLALARSDRSWLQRAKCFAAFALQHFDDLEFIPDRPYSLYEGAVGLACLLMDLGQPELARFPLYEL